MSIHNHINPHVLDLVAYQPGKPIEETARELGLNPTDIVKLASNENPLGPSPLALQAMFAAAKGTHIYPDGASYKLRTALAQYHGVGFDETIVGAGSSEIIELLCHAFLNEESAVIAAKHSFAVYPIVTKLFNAQFVEVPNKPDYTHDLQKILQAITPQTRLVFITNPTNPLGTIVSQAEIDAYMAAVPDHVITVFDEAYVEFMDEPPDTLRYVREGRHVVILRTFSKLYGLAGLRVGYGIAPTAITAAMHRTRAPFNLHLIAQEAAVAALHDEEHKQATIKNNNLGIIQYERAFIELGLEWIPTHGNFILVKVGDGQAIFNTMLRRGVIVRAQGSYGLPQWIRITIGTPQENARCIQELTAALVE